jgi:hypothetical protein
MWSTGPGSTNTVASALSRCDAESTNALMALSADSFKLFDDLHVEHRADQALRAAVATGDRGTILAHAHDTGHKGTEKTLHRLYADFHTPGEHGAVRDFVCTCEVCQRNKGEQLRLAGLLQPLEVPTEIWADIAMDLVEGFPHINERSVILIVVDRVVDGLSKYTHFIALGHPYMVTSVAWAFFNNIVRLHDIPSSIVSDRMPSSPAPSERRCSRTPASSFRCPRCSTHKATVSRKQQTRS